MFENRKLIHWNRLLAKVLIAGSVFLCSAGNAFAAPDLVFTNNFIPAEPGRTHIDIGGTWNGAAEVATGDGFTLSIENQVSPGSTPAFDIADIPVTVPPGFVLASLAVSVTDSDPGVACPDMSATASQGGSGGIVTIDIASNASTIINPGCTYNYTFRLETDTTAVAGTPSLGYSVSYHEVDGTAPFVIVPFTPTIVVNEGLIALTKTTAESFPLDGVPVNFNVAIQNTGTGGLFAVSLSDLLGTGLTAGPGALLNPPALPTGSVISPTEYRFNYIAAGETVNVNVQATTNFPLASATCPTLSNTASVVDRTLIVANDSASIPFDLGALSISHLGTSRCVLCGTGTVTLRLSNVSGVEVDNIVITEDLLASELGIVTSTFRGVAVVPTQAGTQYTWDLSTETIPAGGTADLVFTVAYDTATFGINEDLARNNTNISASVDYGLSCGVTQPTETTGIFPLTLDQPLPQVTKLARNVDAAQPNTAYAATVFGHVDDDVIWRVRVENTGPINLQDVVLDDTITGNFDIDYVCPTESDANSAASGGPIGDCDDISGGVTTVVNNFLMNDPFGVAGSDDVGSVPAFEDIFYVGKIRSSCGVETNNNNIEWGCDVDGTVGGLNSAALFTGATVDNAFATLSSEGTGALAGTSVTHTALGTDGGTDVGSRGIVTITVTNDTGGTMRGLVIDDVLPASYVVDNSAPITYAFTPAFGAAYGGAADEMTHNIDLTPANLLTNTAPQFVITSNGDTGDNAVDFDLFREGDTFTITYQIVLIDPTRYDLVADLDTSPELDTGDDPDSTFNVTVTNGLTITYDDTCTFTGGPDLSRRYYIHCRCRRFRCIYF